MIRLSRLLPVALLLAPIVVLGGGTAAADIHDAVSPCLFSVNCEPIVGAGATMAVPLFRPSVQGTDGGWSHPTLCCTQINWRAFPTVRGTINGKPAAVVPDGGDGVLGATINIVGAASIVYAVAGRTYRYTRYASDVMRSNFDDDPTRWTVTSDAYAWRCTQRGARRDPVADCGTGTHQFTRGTVAVAELPADPEVYSVTVPVSFSERSVDSRGRPLTTPYRRSTGSWTLETRTLGARAFWTVDWTVAGVGTGHVHGSSVLQPEWIDIGAAS